MSLALQLPSSLTVGPLAPYKSCVSHSRIVRTCVDRDSTIWFFVLFYFTMLILGSQWRRLCGREGPWDVQKCHTCRLNCFSVSVLSLFLPLYLFCVNLSMSCHVFCCFLSGHQFLFVNSFFFFSFVRLCGLPRIEPIN